MGADFLHEAMVKQVGSEDVYFEFVVQLRTDPVKMPIEDSLVNWDKNLSPFRRVALIRIPKQNIDAEGRMAIAENLAFNPWHSLARAPAARIYQPLATHHLRDNL